MSSSATSALINFSTCEISDALIKLGVLHGGHIPDIHNVSLSGNGTRICGPAYTVKMVLTSNTEAPKLSVHFVDTAPLGCILVIDAPPEAKNAVWGGLMTAGAQARSAAGVIISGRCRDLAEHRLLQFPVYARGHSTLGQAPFTRPSEINIPLVIHPWDVRGQEQDAMPPVRVVPGDWMVADEDGVVCVPRGLEARVSELAAKGRATDEICMFDIKAGKGVQATFRLHRA
ncbi:RraA-like protein [Collybia nuda]|uniref:RraA-like protein n=1 Tax=Collybia nuda TaxID=64659 RepID=A0A9P5Y005_9AGAR|nr:RraA-like protein [Collybia nuda]